MGLPSVLLLSVFLAASLADEVRRPPDIYETELQRTFFLSNLSEKTFKCKAHGTPMPALKWVLTRTYASPPSSATPMKPDGIIKGFRPTMAGEYQCEASNKYGVDVTNPIRLKFLQPAEFDQNKVYSKEGVVGLPTSLKCMTSKRPSLPTSLYSWRVQKESSKEGATSAVKAKVSLGWRRSIGLDGTLYFAFLRTEDSHVYEGVQWYYMCEIKNAMFGDVKSGGDTKLNVKAGSVSDFISVPNELLAAPKVVHVLQGETLELFCFFNGYPDIDYSWSKIGGLPPSLRRYDGTHLSVKDTVDNTLFNGRYVCEGKNVVTSSTKNISYDVIIDVLPYFKDIVGKVENTNATIGEEVTFRCIAFGKPLPRISWLVNNKLVTTANKGRNVAFSSNGNEGNYTIGNLQKGSPVIKSDLRVVSCVATSLIGEAYASGYINVLTPLKISVPPQSVTLSEWGQIIRLHCGVTTDPSKEYTVKWSYDSKEIVYRAGKIFLHHNNTLEIRSAEFQNPGALRGKYTCLVQTTAPLKKLEASAYVEYNKINAAMAIGPAASILLWVPIIVAGVCFT